MSSLTSFTRRSFLVMPLALAACYNRQQVVEFNGLSMGTTYRVVAVDHRNKLDETKLRQAVADALAEVNGAMSNWDDRSEISRVNAAPAGAVTPMSPILSHVMQAAAEVNLASAGRFDTTVGPLIELWGFGAPGARSLPDDASIAAVRARSGHENSLVIGSDAVQKKHDSAQVYLAAIGKGYGADHVGRAIERLGITDYMVEIGGDLYASGRNPDGAPWQIGIESPDVADRGMLGVVGVSGKGLASSGDYRNYFEVDGQRYSHLIDPATGRPVEHKTASATVLADNAMLADAWSTAMLVLGREQGLEIAQQHDIAVQFVERDPSVAHLAFKTFASDAFRNLTA
ncbi:FAD:protein FMN transferase [Paracoccus sp. Z330]|uniref:FAD:protein FMN transferase n=1 Tax=Paracoccus onchidii TaxID=3017813 RepID=A0ABT4ZF40_9RHOB|nr:FAD:protein FMN transferase [Paracoccus onchidii]MDB6177563.1 FAD:protein FMN transferase [Paracoccus onchidii]